jgi:hypothetical protein
MRRLLADGSPAMTWGPGVLRITGLGKTWLRNARMTAALG